MDEDIEMEEEEGMVEVYQVFEIDFDYEFDATRFYDFTRVESEAELRLSESWFCTAPNYPPSPFVAQLELNGLNSPHVDKSPKSKHEDRLSMDDAECCDEEEARGEDSKRALLKKLYDGGFPRFNNQAKCLHEGSFRGLTFFNHLAHDTKKSKSKSLAKPCIRNTSTLMKPTVSQLAKQNQQHKVCGSSRFPKNEVNSGAHTGNESQASKRQKLDGGLLRRIVDMKQPVSLTHKLPKKDAGVQGINTQTKLRITIPREPDLATAHRAERIRSTSTKEMENSTATMRRFKARPINKKIFEAPVLPFPRRTTQQMPDLKILSKVHAHNAMQTGNKDGKRVDSVDVPKETVCQVVHSFKARPLDRKILTSRGDLGVFRNNKRNVTVPREFELQTAKRTQPNLPTELFSKLSLAGEPHPKNCAQVELPPRTSIPAKGSKENRWESCHQNHQNMTHQAKEKQDAHDGKERLAVANGRIAMSRPSGSRH